MVKANRAMTEFCFFNFVIRVSMYFLLMFGKTKIF